MKRFALLLTGLLLVATSFAQKTSKSIPNKKGYKINVKISGFRDTN